MNEKYRKCSRCGGSGREIDNISTGLEMRRKRIKAGKSLRATAIEMNISAPFLSDLELGRRNWSAFHISKFLQAIR